MLTNVYRREIIERFLADKPAAERELLLPVEGVSEPMGAGAIDEILRRYPSYEAYFADEFGLDAARLKALRDFIWNNWNKNNRSPCRKMAGERL